jgi:protoporphyrinogen oxidase
MRADPRVVVIGAGPTGLGAAWRLQEIGASNWTVHEAGTRPGGLASSVVDRQGFTWDLGGHVLFSHYKYFDALMNQALGDRWVEHVREAWVYMRDRWIPYPFQNNIWRLPDADLTACLDGLVAVATHKPAERPATFRDWLLASFGQGLCDTFMFPYNFKVWAHDPSRLNVEWMGERVATVDLARILRNLVLKRDDVSWGPNSTFRFPLHGGTGAIWESVCGQLPPERVLMGRAATRIDPEAKTVVFSDGSTVDYDVVISTMPLDRLLTMVSGRTELAALACEFVYSSSHIVGVGLEGQPPESLRTKCWMYFPENRVPFYRATVFSNYSPNNVALPGRQWSLMAEVSESPEKPVNASTVVDEVVDGFVDCGFIDRASVVSRWHQRLEHGYPTPWHGRDAVLREVEAALQAIGIYSRGRFGAWKYEVSNQDHSVMQGVEAVNHIFFGARERTYQGEMTD